MCHDPVRRGFLNLQFVPRRWGTNTVQILRFNDEKTPFCIESIILSSSILKLPVFGNQWYTVFLMKELDLAYFPIRIFKPFPRLCFMARGTNDVQKEGRYFKSDEGNSDCDKGCSYEGSILAGPTVRFFWSIHRIDRVQRTYEKGEKCFPYVQHGLVIDIHAVLPSPVSEILLYYTRPLKGKISPYFLILLNEPLFRQDHDWSQNQVRQTLHTRYEDQRLWYTALAGFRYDKTRNPQWLPRTNRGRHTGGPFLRCRKGAQNSNRLLKLLFDQNISFRVAARLKSEFPSCAQVRELALEDKSDREIWEYAKKEGFTIVTFDADFFDLVTLYGHPPKVVWLRVGNTSTENLITVLQKNTGILTAFITDANQAQIGCLEIHHE